MPTESGPDVRFLLANERTLLAWVRTGVALQAAGIGVLHFAPRLGPDGLIGLGLLVLGAAGLLIGWRGYRRVDRAIRADELPPTSHLPALVTLGVFAVALVLLVSAAADLLR